MFSSVCKKCLLLSSYSHKTATYFVTYSMSDAQGLNKLAIGQKKLSQEAHWYELESTKWQSRRELAKLLLDTKIFEDDNILVLNKPGGLAMHGAVYKEEAASGTVRDTELSVNEVLPHLHKAVNAESLSVIYAQYRLYSGIIVLTKNDEATKSYSKYFVHVRTNKVPCQNYWAVTVDVPTPTAIQKEILPVQREKVEGWTLSIKPKQASLMRRKDGRMILSEISLETLKVAKSSQYRVALVQLQPTTIKWDALNLFLLHKMSPILGDHKYSCRLKQVLGRPVLMEPKSHLPVPQELPYELQTKLGLRESEECAVIPLHLHCSQLNIPQIRARRSWRSSKLLTLAAPPPAFFQKTMSILNLTPEGFQYDLPS